MSGYLRAYSAIRHAGALVPYSRPAKRIKLARQLGTSIGRFAWNNRASIAKMARGFRMRRPVRRRRRRAKYSSAARLRRAQLGRSRHRPQQKVAQTVQINPNTGWNNRKPYIWDLTDIGEGTSRNLREHAHANISGVKYCLNIINAGITATQYVNIWIGCVKSGNPKEQFVGGTTFSGEALTNIVDFFTSNGDESGTDFTNTGLDYLERHCRPINSAKYLTLRHHRFQIAGTTAGGDRKNKVDSEKLIMKYLPIKRQVSYSGAAGDSEEDLKVYMVLWYEQIGTAAGGAPGTNTNIEGCGHFLTYFREPRA